MSRKLSESPNVSEISVMMGTPANKSLLDATGFWHPLMTQHRMISVLRLNQSADTAIVDEIAQALDESLKALAQGQQQTGKTPKRVRSWRMAKNKFPNANVVLVSIAGEFAAELADQSIRWL